uniref:Fe2OG dioxygenase domain-containing protein n=1 Tax=Chaetoceros debilis TaxID=122233 RepID=A0A7S3V909_9STRA
MTWIIFLSFEQINARKALLPFLLLLSAFAVLLAGKGVSSFSIISIGHQKQQPCHRHDFNCLLHRDRDHSVTSLFQHNWKWNCNKRTRVSISPLQSSPKETQTHHDIDIDDGHGHGATTEHSIRPPDSNKDGQALIPPNILRPPEPLRSLKVGDKVDAFRRTGIDGSSNFSIERISYSPDAFVLRNFLSHEECQQIQSMAKSSDMGQAETITKNDTKSRTNCQVAWIPSAGGGRQGSESETSSSGVSASASASRLVPNMVASAANLFLSQSVMGNPSAGVEDLQVLKYGVGGEFVLHHDGVPRVLTIIYYLNGVGGTWFPLAKIDESDNGSSIDESGMEEKFFNSRNSSTPLNKSQALDLGKGLKPGHSGVLVKGKTTSATATATSKTLEGEDGNGSKKKGDSEQNVGNNNNNNNNHIAWIDQGDALVFYNYLDDGSARLDWRALHSGLPTTEEDGEKWIANHWFRVNGLAEI